MGTLLDRITGKTEEEEQLTQQQETSRSDLFNRITGKDFASADDTRPINSAMAEDIANSYSFTPSIVKPVERNAMTDTGTGTTVLDKINSSVGTLASNLTQNSSPLNSFFTGSAPTNITPNLPQYATEPSQLTIETPKWWEFNKTVQNATAPWMNQVQEAVSQTPGQLANIPKEVGASALELPANIATTIGDLGNWNTIPQNSIFQEKAGIEPTQAETPTTDYFNAISQDLRTPATEIRESMAPAPIEQQIFTGALGGAIQSIPALATGNVLAMAPMAYGSALTNAEQQGYTGDSARMYAVMSTGVEMLTEYLPLKELQGIISSGGKGMAGSLAREALEEFIGEGLSEWLDPYLQRATINTEAELATLANILQAGVTGAVSGVMMGGAAMGMHTNVNTMLQNPSSPEAIQSGFEIISAMEVQAGKQLTELRERFNLEFAQQVADAKMTPNVPSVTAPQIQPTIEPNYAVEPQPLTTSMADSFANLNIEPNQEVEQPLQQGDLIRTTDGKTALFESESYGYTTATDTATGEPLVLKEGTYSKVELPTAIEADISTFIEPTQVGPVKETMKLPNTETKTTSLLERITTPKVEIDTTAKNTLTDDISGVTAEPTQLTINDTKIETTRSDAQIGTYTEQMQEAIADSEVIEDDGDSVVIERDGELFELTETETGVQEKPLMEMNLQKFADKAKEVQNALDNSGLDSKTLKKHQTILDEFINKNVTRRTTKEFNRLVDIADSIKGIKEANKAKVLETKAEGKAKVEAAELKAKERLAKEIDRLRTVADNKTARQNKSKVIKDIIATAKKISKRKMADEPTSDFQSMFTEINLKSGKRSAKKIAELKSFVKLAEAEGTQYTSVVEDAITMLNQKQLGNMTMDELASVKNALTEIQHKQANINKIRIEGKTENADNIREANMDDLSGKKGLKETTSGELGNKKDINITRKAQMLKTLARGISSGKYTFENTIFKILRDAQNNEFSINKTVRDMMPNGYRKYRKLIGSKKWNAYQELTLPSGTKKYTSDEKVHIKLAARDQHNLTNMTDQDKGGLRRKGEKVQHITEADIDAIKLNKDEQAVYDAYVDVYEYTGEIADEAFYNENGWRMKMEDNYYPTRVDQTTLDSAVVKKVNNSDSIPRVDYGFTKTRTNAIKPIYLESASNVLDGHVSEVAKMVAYNQSIADINKIMYSKDAKAFREKLIETSGEFKSDTSYIEQAVRDKAERLQGIVRDSDGKLDRFLRRNGTLAILSYRATTPVIQFGSYFFAREYLKESSLVKGFKALKSVKKTIDEMVEYNARVAEREVKGQDREIALATQEATRTGSKTSGAKKALKGVAQFGMKGIHAVDMTTLSMLWEATKAEVSLTMDTNADGFLEEVSRVFDDVLDTQPNFTELERPELLTSQNPVTKAFTLFSSAKFAALNSVIRSTQSGDPVQIYRATSAFVQSITYMTLARMLVGFFKGDDKKWYEYLEQTATGSMPFINIPFDIKKGYDQSVLSIDMINDLSTALRNSDKIFSDDPQTQLKALKALVEAVSTIGGFPAENLIDLARLPISTAQALGVPVDKELYWFDEIFNPIATNSQYYNQLFNAIENDNMVTADALLEDYEKYDINLASKGYKNSNGYNGLDDKDQLKFDRLVTKLLD